MVAIKPLIPLRVFIEHDARCFHLAEQVMRDCSRNVVFGFVPMDRGAWYVPYLCNYGDMALYLAADAVVNGDIARYWKQARWKELASAYVHEGSQSSAHPDIILFRNKFCQQLTPAYIIGSDESQLAPSVWAGPDGVGILEE